MSSRPNWRQRGYDKVYDRNHRRVIREESTCWICGEPVDKAISGRDPDGPTVDHVKPRSRGGTNQRDNLRLAHARCNAARRAGITRARPATPHPGLVDQLEAS